MSIYKHGLTVGIQRINGKFYLTMKAIGTLTHEDYEKITPMLESAIQGVSDPKIYAIIDCTELEGWELQAAWDDFKLGLKHGSEFIKIAIFGAKDWIKVGSKVASWFIHGEIKNFDSENEAFDWIKK